MTLLAVIGGGQLAGFAGVIFAALRVLFDFVRTRIRTSPEVDPGSPERL